MILDSFDVGFSYPRRANSELYFKVKKGNWNGFLFWGVKEIKSSRKILKKNSVMYGTTKRVLNATIIRNDERNNLKCDEKIIVFLRGCQLLVGCHLLVDL